MNLVGYLNVIHKIKKNGGGGKDCVGKATRGAIFKVDGNNGLSVDCGYFFSFFLRVIN